MRHSDSGGSRFDFSDCIQKPHQTLKGQCCQQCEPLKMQQALDKRHCIMALPHVPGEEMNISMFTVPAQDSAGPSLVSCIRHRVSENTLWSSVLLLVLPFPEKPGIQRLNSRWHSQALHPMIKVPCASLSCFLISGEEREAQRSEHTLQCSALWLCGQNVPVCVPRRLQEGSFNRWRLNVFFSKTSYLTEFYPKAF